MIPMLESIRSLNLSNSVAVVSYEFFRQKGFINFKKVDLLKGNIRTVGRRRLS